MIANQFTTVKVLGNNQLHKFDSGKFKTEKVFFLLNKLYELFI